MIRMRGSKLDQVKFPAEAKFSSSDAMRSREGIETLHLAADREINRGTFYSIKGPTVQLAVGPCYSFAPRVVLEVLSHPVRW